MADSRRPRPRSGPLEARREGAIQSLERAFARGDLSMSEYDERLSLATGARNETELAVLTADVPSVEVAEAARLPAVVPAAASALPAIADDVRPRRITAIFGGSARKGGWRVPARLRVRAIFGGVELDFREAVFDHDVVEVKCLALFGGIDVTVPPNVRVEVEGHGIFGGFSGQTPRVDDTTAQQQVIRLTGAAIFGGVDVRVRVMTERIGSMRGGRHRGLPWKGDR